VNKKLQRSTPATRWLLDRHTNYRIISMLLHAMVEIASARIIPMLQAVRKDRCAIRTTQQVLGFHG
jgi:hypothetical protein